MPEVTVACRSEAVPDFKASGSTFPPARATTLAGAFGGITHAINNSQAMASTIGPTNGRRCRDKISPGNSANSGLIARFREISVRTRMRGGAERTRTACQARSRYRTGLSRVISPRQCRHLEQQHCPERTGIRAPLERCCPLISGAKGAPRSCPAGCIAEVGLWWCGATPRNRTEDLDVKACKEATDGVSASHRSNDKIIATQCWRS